MEVTLFFLLSLFPYSNFLKNNLQSPLIGILILYVIALATMLTKSTWSPPYHLLILSSNEYFLLNNGFQASCQRHTNKSGLVLDLHLLNAGEGRLFQYYLISLHTHQYNYLKVETESILFTVVNKVT